LDACAVVAYGHILRPDVLAVPRTGWVNLHFSLLPAWRGAAPVQRAIMAGDTITGATTFLLDEGMDTGPTLGMMTETIRPTDTSGDLLNRLALAGSHLLVATMDGIEAGQLSPAAQPADGISLAPKLTSDDAFLNWSWPALRVSRVARACTPEPGPWTLLSTPGEEAARLRITVGPIRPDITDLAPGQLRPGKRELLVGTGTHAIALDTVHPAGKRPMQAADWARGAHLTSQSTLAITSPQEASQ
jgi:methionyl-tRNA formyltransferase